MLGLLFLKVFTGDERHVYLYLGLGPMAGVLNLLWFTDP